MPAGVERQFTDREQEEHNAELGQRAGAVDAFDQAQRMRAYDGAGADISKHRRKPEAAEQGHGHHSRQQEDQDVSKIARMVHSGLSGAGGAIRLPAGSTVTGTAVSRNAPGPRFHPSAPVCVLERLHFQVRRGLFQERGISYQWHMLASSAPPVQQVRHRIFLFAAILRGRAARLSGPETGPW